MSSAHKRKKPGIAARRSAARKPAVAARGDSHERNSLDGALTITYFNAAAERMFARAGGQAVAKKFLEVFPEASRSAFAAKLEETGKRQEVLSFRTELGAAGRRKPYAVRLRAFSAGISVFCRRADESEPPSRPNESA